MLSCRETIFVTMLRNFECECKKRQMSCMLDISIFMIIDHYHYQQHTCHHHPHHNEYHHQQHHKAGILQLIQLPRMARVRYQHIAKNGPPLAHHCTTCNCSLAVPVCRRRHVLNSTHSALCTCEMCTRQIHTVQVCKCAKGITSTKCLCKCAMWSVSVKCAYTAGVWCQSLQCTVPLLQCVSQCSQGLPASDLSLKSPS